LVAGATGLLVLHACQDTSQPTELNPAAATVSRTVTITGIGTGSGVVTSSPAGINCAITAGVAAATGCKAGFADGSIVTLTAVPKAGHSFERWYGSCSGAGSGTVKTQAGLTPAINCTITNGTAAATGCSGVYAAYTALTLTATPAAGFVFTGWGTPCSGTGTCQYAAIKTRTISATFAPAGSSTAATKGKWGAAFATPVVAVHVHLLPTGKVLLWGHRGEAELWDPAHPAAGFTAVNKTY